MRRPTLAAKESLRRCPTAVHSRKAHVQSCRCQTRKPQAQAAPSLDDGMARQYAGHSHCKNGIPQKNRTQALHIGFPTQAYAFQASSSTDAETYPSSPYEANRRALQTSRPLQTRWSTAKDKPQSQSRKEDKTKGCRNCRIGDNIPKTWIHHGMPTYIHLPVFPRS